MRRPGLAALALGFAALLAVAGTAGANGATQREIQGRVVSADAGTGTFVVERTFRGKTARVSLKAAPTLTVFSCAGEAARLDGVKVGATVSVFYEATGSEGVANLIVIEPGR